MSCVSQASLVGGNIYATSTSVVTRGWLKSRIQRRNWMNCNYRTKLTKLRHRIRYSYVCSRSQLHTQNCLWNRAWFTLRDLKKLFSLAWRRIAVQPLAFKKKTHVAKTAIVPQATHEHFFQNWPGLAWSVNNNTGFIKPKFSWCLRSHEFL